MTQEGNGWKIKRKYVPAIRFEDRRPVGSSYLLRREQLDDGGGDLAKVCGLPVCARVIATMANHVGKV